MDARLAVKAVNLILLVLFFGLQYSLWAGNQNMFDWYRLKQAIAQQENENRELMLRNQKLDAEVFNLKHGGTTIETIARSELGYIRKGENFYQIMD